MIPDGDRDHRATTAGAWALVWALVWALAWALVRHRFAVLSPHLDEKGRRLLAAVEAQCLGRGGIAQVSDLTGVARSTIGRGLKELDGTTSPPAPDRVRRAGGGRKPATERQPGLLAALEALVAPATRGDPERPVLWVSKSTRHLAKCLEGQGFSASRSLVGRLLGKLGYTLQANAKSRHVCSTTPHMVAGSAPALRFSRPARRSRVFRPAWSLSCSMQPFYLRSYEKAATGAKIAP